MINRSILTLNKKTSLTFILIFSTVVVFDSSIVTFCSYSGIEFPGSLNVVIFVIFYIIFASSSIILLASASKIIPRDRYKQSPLRLVYFEGVIIATQILSAAFILVIILQILLLNRYSISWLSAQTYLSHFSALVFLSLLVFLFGRWLTSKRSYTVLLYTIAFLLSSVNLVISLLYIESYLSSSVLPDVNSYPITSIVTNFAALLYPESLTPAFDVLSLCSFLCMWIATATLLSHFRYKLGRTKYFLLLGVPLIYYIFPFENYFGNFFFPLMQSSPLYISLLYILIFSATKQVGALTFSLVFWSASSLVREDRVRKSLLLSSVGIAIFYSSVALAPLQYHVYPPYGLITEAFIPLGTYFLFVGIFTSAIHVSRDSNVRKEVYHSTMSQLRLLKNIGVSEMEKELEKKYKIIERNLSELEGVKTEYLLEDYSESNVKEILNEVLNELYHSKGKKELKEF
jgi:hypothetical protein